MPAATLLLVHEPEAACVKRLLGEGFDKSHAAEISSYLAQSTDLAGEFDDIAKACDRQGLTFRPAELDEASVALAGHDPQRTLGGRWTVVLAFFRGGVESRFESPNGLRTFGADDSLFALCQDKFRSGAVLGALGLPVPQAGLARNGEWLVEPPPSASGWFVKPNRLGAKIGIWSDSHCQDLAGALAIGRRIFSAYRDDTLVQPYVPGRNVRASFLGLDRNTGIEALGISFVDSGADFQTMSDSLALYGETGDAAKTQGVYAEPLLESVAETQPNADFKIRQLAGKLMQGLGLRDVFSIDLRVEADDTLHLIEFEVCPGLPCFDFRSYCRTQWHLSLPDAMAKTAANRLFDSGSKPI